MCKTYQAKHKRYEIKITFKNGQIKTLDSNNKTNYNSMVKEYSIAKKNYENNQDVVSMDFVGIIFDNQIKVFWTKENNIKTEKEKYIDENLDKDCRVTTREITERLDLLIAQKEHYKNVIEICEKHRDTLLHMILASQNTEFKTDKEEQDFKTYIFNELYKNEKKRRYAKNNLSDLYGMFGRLSLEEVDDILKRWCKERKIFTQDSKEFKNNVEKEVTYKNDKERIKLMKQYQSKYDKVINNKKEHKLYFYNHVGFGKKH